MPPSKSKYSIGAPLSTFATVSFYVNDPNFNSRLTKEERPRCFTVSSSKHPKPLNIFRYRTYYSDSPELPATDRGTSGDIWSSGTPGKPSNSSGLQHWVKISGNWVKIEPDSDERVHHPFLPNVYLLERFWVYDSDVDRHAEPLGIEASTSASAATSDRSLKRTRTEDEREDKRPTKRHRNLWYEDGNVVVQVENTRFRLFRSKLAKQSPILKRLLDERFSLLRDEEEADVKSFSPGFEIVENCPVISFDSTGVRLKDFEELMTAIEDGYPSHLEPPLFSSLARILEASRILQVDRREQWARNAIQSIYSSDLDTVTSTHLPDPLLAIKLSRSCEIPEIRTRAFYELIRSPNFTFSHENVKHVRLSEDGSCLTSLPIHANDLVKAISVREAIQLEWIMQTTCEDFKTSRAPTCPLRLPKSEDPSSSSSSTVSSCLTDENLRHHWENIVVECGIFDVGLLDPIEGARLLSEKTLWKKSCHGCAQLQHDIWTRIRENLWTKLGELVN